MRLGTYVFSKPVMLAPMAGITDRPFRQICRELGADLAFSEMVKANTQLHATEKTQTRLDHRGESRPHCVQILGNDPKMMAEVAAQNQAMGIDVIDINMGCPAKKVLKKDAGSALLAQPKKVRAILEAVVAAVDLPVTLKIRTGTAASHINAEEISKIAEESGVAALSIHGRTREQRFTGQAEYDTIAKVVQARNIPVLANGDIRSAAEAKAVLAYTDAAGLLIGRAAQGNPWIFKTIKAFLKDGTMLPPPEASEVERTLLRHLDGLCALYGEHKAARIARKHIAWYCGGQAGASALRARCNQCEDMAQLRQIIHLHFATLDLGYAA